MDAVSEECKRALAAAEFLSAQSAASLVPWRASIASWHATTLRPMTALLIVSALACILGEYLDLRTLVYVAKPLATIAVILIAARSTHPVSGRYKALITAGLVCSLAGDVFLMLPGDQFVAGLSSFLVAHLLYITAFVRHGGGLRDPKAALVFAIGIVMLAVLWPTLGALRIPVTIYVVVIATMAWQAIARWRLLGTADARLAAVGAMSFLVSDASLAFGRFRGELPGSTVLVLATYWFAQWCIARSVTPSRTPR